MVHHVVLCELRPGVTDERLEWIMRQTRIGLLKLSEVRAIQCGKRIEKENAWGFFFSADYESMDKMSMAHEDPIYQGLLADIIGPHVRRKLASSYESDPGKDVRYS